MTGFERHLDVVRRRDAPAAGELARALVSLPLPRGHRAVLEDVLGAWLEAMVAGRAAVDGAALAAVVHSGAPSLQAHVAAMLETPDRQVAAVALAAVGDRRATSAIAELVAATGSAEFWRLLDGLDAAAASPPDRGALPAADPEARLLRAVSLARSGDPAALLEELDRHDRPDQGADDREPSVLDGDPGMVEALCAGLAPLPNEVTTVLRERTSADHSAAVRAAATGLLAPSRLPRSRVDPGPVDRSLDEAVNPPPHTELSGAWRDGAAPSADDLAALTTAPWDQDSPGALILAHEIDLRDVDAADVARIVGAAVRAAPSTLPPAMVGNAIIELAAVARAPVLPLDAGALLVAEDTAAVPTPQVAWLLARTSLAAVLAATATLLDDGATDRVAELLGAVARAPVEPPRLGAGGGSGLDLGHDGSAGGRPPDQPLLGAVPRPVSPPQAADLPDVAAPPQAADLPDVAAPPQPADRPSAEAPSGWGGGTIRRLYSAVRNAFPSRQPPDPAIGDAAVEPAPLEPAPPVTWSPAEPVEDTGVEPDDGGWEGWQDGDDIAMSADAGAVDETPPPPDPDAEEEHPVRATRRSAWPRVDARDVVAPGDVFQLTVGLRATRQKGVRTPGPVALPPGPVVLDVAVLADGFALVSDRPGSPRSWQVRLHVDDEDPYPAVTFDLLARDRADLGPHRSIGVTFAVGGEVVGIATRAITVAVDATTQPASPDPSERDEPPMQMPAVPPGGGRHDLTITVTRGDDAAHHRLVVDVWSPLVDLPPPPVDNDDRMADLGKDPEAFLRSLMRQFEDGDDTPLQLLDALRGKGVRVARALPTYLVDAVHAVLAAADARGTHPARILVLTEDPYLPWELARFTDEDGTKWFLGERAAVSRWPYGSPPPDATPPERTEIRAAGAITAVYDGVDGWKRLEDAEAEVSDLEARLGRLHRIPPTWDDVRAALHGDPAVDLLHVALHGRHAAGEARSGLVLLREVPQENMPPVEDFLQPDQVTDWSFGQRQPVVFLNACQVGAAGEVLGDAGGMAIEFVRIGASAVIAPLWNVDDGQARAAAEAFYDEAGSTPGPEVLRQRRAAVTDAAVRDPDPKRGRAALTDLAYQFWGAPDHRLAWSPDVAPAPAPGDDV